jgi:hypothetical protein
MGAKENGPGTIPGPLISRLGTFFILSVEWGIVHFAGSFYYLTSYSAVSIHKFGNVMIVVFF